MRSVRGTQGGQLIVEAILIIVLLMGFATIVSSYFKNDEVLRKLISGPFQQLAGMLQNGVWGPVAQTSRSHPSGAGRHVSILGDTP